MKLQRNLKIFKRKKTQQWVLDVVTFSYDLKYIKTKLKNAMTKKLTNL